MLVSSSGLRHDRISTFSPTIAESRTSQDAQKRQRSFGRIAFRTPRLPRFTFCATAEIETRCLEDETWNTKLRKYIGTIDR